MDTSRREREHEMPAFALITDGSQQKKLLREIDVARNLESDGSSLKKLIWMLDSNSASARIPNRFRDTPSSAATQSTDLSLDELVHTQNIV